jgi:hypothetical protein
MKSIVSIFLSVLILTSVATYSFAACPAGENEDLYTHECVPHENASTQATSMKNG